MKAKRLRCLVLVVLLIAPALELARAGAKPAADVKGTWSGTFLSRHPDVAPFTITVVINPDGRGHLIGDSTLNSDCVKNLHLYVTVKGSSVSLAGSDPDGANLTFNGSVDSTGTLLNLSYIINGSASGRCESDDGDGNMGKR
jgi:hypothetical protein